MGAANISGIGNVFVQGQTMSTDSDAKTKDVTAAFSEVMSQMTSMAGNLSAHTDADTITPKVVVKAEDTFRVNQNVKVSDSQQRDIRQDGLSDKTDKFAEDVKQVLEEELGVTEEQIEEAMAVLGLSFADLMNPNQLSSLVAELTGAEDMGVLLCSEAFVNVLKEVGALSEKLLEELGMTSEELSAMLEAAQKPTEQVAADTKAAEPMQKPTEQMTADTKAAEPMQKPIEQMAADTEVAEQVTADTEAAADTPDILRVNEKTEEKASSTEEGMPAMSEEALETAEGSAADTAAFTRQQGQQSMGDTGAQAENQMAGTVNHTAAETSFAQVQNEAAANTPQVDVADIMRQITEYAKAIISRQTSTIQMQLNPENLGKIYMEVTSKNGEVSAHITAQNEVVKEALENQLIELRQNLNQAGVKVDAVEVTVESHEFERNLEQDARQQEEQAAEQEQTSKRTRQINLGDLDELSGLMSEEENLVAQMMADQGNSIDYMI